MSTTTIIRSHAGMPLLIHGGAGAPAALSITPSKGKALATQHLNPQANDTEEENKSDWIFWGVNDDFPRDIYKMMKRTTVGRAGLQKLTTNMYGQRLIAFKVEDMSDGGKEIIKFMKYEPLNTILSRSNMKAVRLAQTQDYNWFALAYAEIIFTEDKSEVYSINYQKTSHCRFAKIDENTGRIPYVYVSGKFPDAKVGDCQKIKVIDMINFVDQIEEIRQDTSTHKYIMPLMWPDVMNDYYPCAAWDSARESGWLDIAISIPAYKKALFKNQMSLKYDIKIPMEYFDFKYTNFAAKTQVEKDQIFQELYDDINARLTGAENAQKALLSFYKTDQRTGKGIGQWEITVIDDKMKTEAYLPDTTAADFQISYAMGLNPAGSGQGTTAGVNKGGSDIREAGLDLRAQLRAHRDILLSWFDFVKIYNNWDTDLELGIQDQVLTTLDQGKGTEKVVS
ncbi:hypothetical protein [Pedobacter sp. Leaf250]|uniref:hypothetical protein n=1 Tax=Pedobacter sp. Leaf250 TaxID=2876559 RepID=UPI001E372993|nr:hypothetical protein [Pedobacter sp. Leaf250]